MLPPTIGRSASTTANLGRAYLDLGRAEEALAQFDLAVSTATRVLHERHGTVGLIRGQRALTLAALQRDEEAEREFLAALEIVEERLGAEHPRVVQLRRDLAASSESRGRATRSGP